MKKLSVRMFSFLLLFIFAVSSPLGEVSGAKTVQVEAAVKLSKTKLSLFTGDKAKLSLSSSKKKVWLSTDNEIASVSSAGAVEAQNPGKCDIYCIVGSKAYKCSVTVTMKPKTPITFVNGKEPLPSVIKASSQKATAAKNVVVAQNKLKEAVDTSSALKTAYSSSSDVKGRTPVYFYHPRRLVLSNTKAEVFFWVSSKSEVIRVYNDGAVEAYGEGIADVTAYDIKGQPLETFYLYATTWNDADPVGSRVDYSDSGRVEEVYKQIRFQDIQESVNNITDYAAILFANNAYYSTAEEGSSPRILEKDKRLWIQSGNSDWIFRNNAGICCNVCAGAVYALVGDYEKTGIIQMAGPNGHTVFWCYENGSYYVYDFTNVISEGNGKLHSEFSGNVYNYVDSTIGKGKTLKAAFDDCSKKSNSFYYTNKIIYSVELTGLDYYPAESNNWMQTGDFTKPCVATFVEGTQVEVLYTAKGVKFTPEYVKRSNIPDAMRVITKASNTEQSHTDTNLGRLRSIGGNGSSKASAVKLSAAKGSKAYTQKKLKSVIDSSSKSGKALNLSSESKDRKLVYLYETEKLDIGSSKALFWYSTDANIIRVQSDGTIKPYGEGAADVYAVDSQGKTIKCFKLFAVTRADADPLAATLGDKSGKLKDVIFGFSMQGQSSEPVSKEPYSNIYLEDIPDKLSTVTDYAAWIVSNYAYPNGAEEPRGPQSRMSLDGAVWFGMANSDCVFTNYVGVCCNYAAGANVALYGDYEANGLIMMSGRMGHVINWFYENGEYYVIDYMCVSEERDFIVDQYGADVGRYVRERIGRGKTLRTALDDYMSKNPSRSWYFENQILYGTAATGFKFYQDECNNWSSQGMHRKGSGVNNILYTPEADPIELLYVDSSYRFDYEILAWDAVPQQVQTVYFFDKTGYSYPIERLGEFDNTSMSAEEYNRRANNNGGSGSAGPGGGNTPSGEVLNEIRDMYQDMGSYMAFWGFVSLYPENYIIRSEMNGKPVTLIDEYALCNKPNLKYLEIPESVTKIADSALDTIKSTCTLGVYSGSYAEKYAKQNGYKYKIVQ